MTNKLILVILSVAVVVAAAAILTWQFWPTAPSPSPSSTSTPDQVAWSCGETLFYEGKDYDTVKIGDQCWFAENLDYDNGCSDVTWVYESDEGWCGYYDGIDYSEGLLYQWSAAMNGTTTEGAQGLCPDGWHIPSKSEWNILIDSVCNVSGCNCGWGYKGGALLAGRADLWKAGDAYTITDDSVIESDNDFDCSGFGLLPASYRHSCGLYGVHGCEADVWLSTTSSGDVLKVENYTDYAWIFKVYHSSVEIFMSPSAKATSCSVRCLQD